MQNNCDKTVSTISKFKYQPEKIVAGTLYEYTKSNLDGSHPIPVHIYVAAANRLEVLKVSWGRGTNSLVCASMDWETFSVHLLNSYFVLPAKRYKGRPVPPPGMLTAQAQGAFWPDENVFEATMPGIVNRVLVHYMPFHVYNFDLTSLNYVFRHLVDPQTSFEVGIVDPDWDTVAQYRKGKKPGSMFAYKGKAVVEYVGEELCNQKLCRKYTMGGPGMGNKSGFIWVNKDKEYFERVEHPQFDNPEWTNFKIDLKSIDRITYSQWLDLIAEKSMK